MNLLQNNNQQQPKHNDYNDNNDINLVLIYQQFWFADLLLFVKRTIELIIKINFRI